MYRHVVECTYDSQLRHPAVYGGYIPIFFWLLGMIPTKYPKSSHVTSLIYKIVTVKRLFQDQW